MTRFPHKSKRLNIGSYTADVRMSGTDKRETLLLVHGIGASGRYFHRFAEVATKIYNVIVIDLPGYGKTPKPPEGPLTIAELADIVTIFTRSLQLKNVTLVGHSMGAQIVTHAARQQAELYRSIILIGPTTYKNEQTLLMQGLRLAQDTLREPFKANGIIFTDYARMGMGRYLKTAKYMINDQLHDTLVACRLPILIIRGANDPISPGAWITYLASLNNYVTTQTIAGAPHVVQYSRPKELLRVCSDFLNG